MRLAAIYNVFDGEELLGGSVACIRAHVESIILVAQSVSNRGEEYTGGLEECRRLLDQGIADRLIVYAPDLNLSARQNEIEKRRMGLTEARSSSCTHFLHLDCDEYYLAHQFAAGRRLVETSSAAGSVCSLRTYFRCSDLVLEGTEDYWVPFIHRLDEGTDCGSDSYPYRVDPSRRINSREVTELPAELIEMHHFSWVRRDISRKIRNSSSSALAGPKLRELHEDYEQANPGFLVRFWNRRLELVKLLPFSPTSLEILKRFTRTAMLHKRSAMIVTMIPYSPAPFGMDLGRAYNELMSRLGDDDWACFIDHDACFTTRDWYRQLEQIVARIDEPCVLTCKTNRVGSHWQLAENVDRNEHSMQYHRRVGDLLQKRHGTELKEATHESLMSGVVILLSKKTWQQLNGFVSGFLGVDNQLHQAARDAGLRVYLMEGVYVYHWYRAESFSGELDKAIPASGPADTSEAANSLRTPPVLWNAIPRNATSVLWVTTHWSPPSPHGISFDVTVIELPHSSLPHCDETIRNLESLTRTFDCVVLEGVLERVREPQRVLNGCRPLLAANGRVVVDAFNSRNHAHLGTLLHGHFSIGRVGRMGRDPIRFFTRRELEKLLYRSGFETTEVQFYSGQAWQAWCASGRPPKLQARDLRLDSVGPQDIEEFYAEQMCISASVSPKSTFGLTSIILVTHNQLSYTHQCLESIRFRTDERYELIVVDNGSTDATVEYLQAQTDIKLIQNKDNLGFPAAVNQGIGVAGGDKILLLNNDTIVTTGWLAGLLEAFAVDVTIGLVGPCSNEVSGPQRIEVGYRDLANLDGFAWEWRKTNRRQLMNAERLVGFCLLIRRSVIDKIGTLDERFGIGNFEDDDFCLRAIRSGFRAVIARESFVHHFGHRSFIGAGTDLGSLLQRNHRLFEEKWAIPAGSQGTVPTEEDVASPQRSNTGNQSIRSNTIRLSGCLIVRDNESTIRECLESLRPWVDELIVVDTGSRDQTPAIAEELGAKLYHFTWCDDFAAARNQSLQHASGEWIFWMDSDDTISAENGKKLKDLVSHHTPADTFGYIMQVHCPGKDDSGHLDVTIVDHIKLFRNRPDLRFEGRIHEQIMPAIRRLGGQAEWTDIFVTHSGSDHSPEGRRRKQARDLRILKLEEQESPNHPFVLFNLGMTYADIGEHQIAIDALQRCIAATNLAESHLRKAYALLVVSHVQLDELDEADRVCRTGRTLFPDDVELWFHDGFIAHQRGDLQKAADAYLRALAAKESPHFSSLDSGIRGYKTRHNLAVVQEQLGNLHQAEEQYRLAIAAAPLFGPSWRGLANILLLQRNFDQLSVEIERMQQQPPLAAELYHVRAQLAKERGDIPSAVKELESGLAVDPGQTELLEAICQLLFECGSPADAETRLRQLVAIEPKSASAWHNLGTTYLRLDRPQDAKMSFETAIRLRPKMASSYLYLGCAYEQAGDLPGARSAWQQAVGLDPRDPATEESRSRLNRIDGMIDKAHG